MGLQSVHGVFTLVSMAPDLLAESRELILKTSLTFDEIASRTGFSRSWLSKFANGEYTDPGYTRVTKLHAVLVAQRDLDEAERGAA